jgi:hypothetical protein
MSILFTQYLRPNGRKELIEINMSQELEEKADNIIKRGFRFECEVLTTDHVSFTIHDIEKGEDVAIEVVENGPKVPAAIERLVNNFEG